jgi:glycosyltransferase involved in cell wall biosynthesis
VNRVGIIAVVDRAWSDRWQAEANILTRLAEHYPTIWVDPPHHWRASWDRLKAGVPAFRQPEAAGALRVYTPPPWLPSTFRPAILRRLVLGVRLNAVRNRLMADGCDRIILYIWRPKYADALDVVRHDASVYHIVDEYSFSEIDPPTTAREDRLLRSADQVIVHSPALLEKKGEANRNTALVPNGVDYDWFAEPCEEPLDLTGIPHPRVGYCGYVKRQLDWDLIQGLIARHEEWSWIFVGKTSPHPELTPILESLQARPNVHFLGTKSTRELACYPQHFDACIMPYKVDGYTQYIFPLKLHEYLASGRPTVGAPIRTLQDFESVIELADGVEEWSAAIGRAVDPSSRTAAAIEARRAVARDYDWATLAGRVSTLLTEMLDRLEE